MKRAAASAEFGDAYAQQPVSCQFCRSRKLKCDRGRPSCFNCNSRDQTCIYEADQRQSVMSAAQALTSLTERNDLRPNAASGTSDLVQRIERLERAVFASEEPRAERNISFKIPSSKARDSNHRLVNHDLEQQKTSQWLEGLLATNTLGGSPAPSSRKNELSTIIREFPTYNDSVALFRHFASTVDATYRILHHPTTWNLLRQLYGDLGASRVPSSTHLAFFLSIFAGGAYASKKRFQFESPHLQGHSQLALAELWARRAVSLATEPPLPSSVEALQTIVSLAHLCTQIEGLSGSFGILSASGTRMAKAMSIHRLDSYPSREERRKNGANMVDVEIKRRIWWHMVASDWLLSYVGGPHEGTYILHPHQMETFHPSNVEDAAIPTGITLITEETYSSPISSPTSMSYFLHRIKSATLVREVVDGLPPSFFSSPGVESYDEVYERIVSLDQKYQQLLKSLPFFFQLTIEDTISYQALLKEKPYLEWQRYLINFVIHTQLARLHRPFLIRGSRQPKYQHSRLQCIRSAETVIEIRNQTMSDHSAGSFTYVLQHFLTAAIILAMDVCYNSASTQAPRRKQEVLQAFRALEEELNAKLVPSSERIDEDLSRSRLMVQSFQDAVRNLRGLLRKNVPEDESDSAATSSVKDTMAPTDWQRRTAINTSSSSIPNFGMINLTGPTSQANDYHNDTHGESVQGQIEQPLNVPLTQEEISGPDAPGEMLVDELWDDFFTFGSTFNDTDWDALFSNVGADMG